MSDEVARLRAALERYGQHEKACRQSGIELISGTMPPCTCGLAAVLGRVVETIPESERVVTE
jgi:hypothetical protein